MINITYAAMHVRAETEKTTFSCIDEAHTALDIFRFAVFFTGCLKKNVNNFFFLGVYNLKRMLAASEY